MSLLSSMSVLQLFMVSDFVSIGYIKIIKVGSVLFSSLFDEELAW